MGGTEFERSDACKGGAEAEDITQLKSTKPTTMAMPAPLATSTGVAVATLIAPRSGLGVAAPYVQSDPTQTHQVICLGHGCDAHGCGKEGGCHEFARATQRTSWKRNQPHSIRH